MNLEGGFGELHFTIEIKRKETGKVETFELIGKPIKEEEHGSNSQHLGAERGD